MTVFTKKNLDLILNVNFMLNQNVQKRFFTFTSQISLDQIR